MCLITSVIQFLVFIRSNEQHSGAMIHISLLFIINKKHSILTTNIKIIEKCIYKDNLVNISFYRYDNMKLSLDYKQIQKTFNRYVVKYLV